MLKRGKRKILEGIVIKDNNNKTRIVSVMKTYRHPLYKRVLHINKKFTIHDENNSSHLGDKVRIMASRPFSKSKRWVLIGCINK
ncbi:MAG: 30S ribosomal protein S17 [Endomicrobium sp.]|jgi:small subunit ribosomal protein S17|nr:30S ribosomal protein S17 [Endomicrobium sp.]